MRAKAYIAVLLLLSPLAFAGYSKNLYVNVYKQENDCWCSIAIIEMWSDWLTGNQKQEGRQGSMASEYGVNCNGGLNTNELADALENETPNWFNRYRTSSKDYFASQIVKQIQDNEPVAVVGYTKYKDKPWAPNQHYFLVDAFKNSTTSYSSSSSNITGYYINDPAYGVSSLSHIETTSPSTFVSKSNFLNYYSSKYNNMYYLVRD